MKAAMDVRVRDGTAPMVHAQGREVTVSEFAPGFAVDHAIEGLLGSTSRSFTVHLVLDDQASSKGEHMAIGLAEWYVDQGKRVFYIHLQGTSQLNIPHGAWQMDQWLYKVMQGSGGLEVSGKPFGDTSGIGNTAYGVLGLSSSNRPLMMEEWTTEAIQGVLAYCQLAKLDHVVVYSRNMPSYALRAWIHEAERGAHIISEAQGALLWYQECADIPFDRWTFSSGQGGLEGAQYINGDYLPQYRRQVANGLLAKQKE